jgi:hypothetical protein
VKGLGVALVNISDDPRTLLALPKSGIAAINYILIEKCAQGSGRRQ